MNQGELEKDLHSKCPTRDFTTTFQGGQWDRRSFNDLFDYYSPKGVTEEMLMKALIKGNFAARYCNGPRRMVFTKSFEPEIKFWWDLALQEDAFNTDESKTNCGKFTPRYLENLYDSIVK